ncbi:hypothetical protein V1525DRAFT_421332 [Lipomyces kononenkoae]|uniref:Uncharacterized protein n=1 Tax=Lipomyces kononenkoae TaxID=34357 RepID=A0ACC3SUV7_LIPKO
MTRHLAPVPQKGLDSSYAGAVTRVATALRRQWIFPKRGLGLLVLHPSPSTDGGACSKLAKVLLAFVDYVRRATECARRRRRRRRRQRICLFPTTSQKETLRKWVGAQRYIYNKCVALVQGGMRPTQTELRAVLLNSKTNQLKDSEKWLEQYEYDLKDEAIRDFQSNMAKYKKPKKPFTLKFRKGKGTTPAEFVFIDPGVRTLLTCYDSNENVVEVGKAAVVRVQSCCTAGESYKVGWQLFATTRNAKLGERINQLVEDMHKKAAMFRCANYDRVFLLKLNFHTCRKLNRKSKACMATLGHCASFIERP